jgi:hypothetical protein
MQRREQPWLKVHGRRRQVERESHRELARMHAGSKIDMRAAAQVAGEL